MPLEQLYKYQGTNPKPKDFDEFWDKSLAEMWALDPQVELVESEFKTDVAHCYDMFFTGTDGSRVYAKLAVPKNLKEKAPAVLMFHGYYCKCMDWMTMLSYAGSGFVTAALECRGQTGVSEDHGIVSGSTVTGFIVRGLMDEPEKLYYRNVFLDTAMLARIVMGMDEVDEARVATTGSSQGGALTLACAALVPEIKIATPSYPYLCDYKRVWDMDLDTGAYAALREFFRHYDPRHEKEEEYFTKLGYIDLQYLVPRIKAEVLMFTGLLDSTCPPSTQFSAYNKMTCKKSVKIYPDFGHEYLPDSPELAYEKIMTLKK